MFITKLLSFKCLNSDLQGLSPLPSYSLAGWRSSACEVGTVSRSTLIQVNFLFYRVDYKLTSAGMNIHAIFSSSNFSLAPCTIMIYDHIYVSLGMHAKTACVVQVAWGVLYNNYFSASVRCSLCCFTHFCLILSPLQRGINTVGWGGDMLLLVSGSATPSVLPWLVLWKGWSGAWIPHTFLVTLQLSMLFPWVVAWSTLALRPFKIQI